jgi:hypothetical protein
LIVINLGDGDVLKYPNDANPGNIDTAPQELFSIVAANERKDDGGGEPA